MTIILNKEPWRDKVDRASKRDHIESTMSKVGMYVTTHSNQERKENIGINHKTELIKKDQHSREVCVDRPGRENIVTTNTGEDMFKEIWEYIVMDYKAKLINKDQQSRRDIVTTKARENMFKQMEENTVKEHNAELIRKEQHSRENIVTTHGMIKEMEGYNMTDHPSQERQRSIVMGYKAKLFTKDQPSSGKIIATNAGKDVNKERRVFF